MATNVTAMMLIPTTFHSPASPGGVVDSSGVIYSTETVGRLALVLVQLFAAVVCELPNDVEEKVDEGVVKLEPVSMTSDKLVDEKDGRFMLKDVKDVAGFQVSTVAVVVGRSSLSIRPKKSRPAGVCDGCHSIGCANAKKGRNRLTTRASSRIGDKK